MKVMRILFFCNMKRILLVVLCYPSLRDLWQDFFFRGVKFPKNIEDVSNIMVPILSSRCVKKAFVVRLSCIHCNNLSESLVRLRDEFSSAGNAN